MENYNFPSYPYQGQLVHPNQLYAYAPVWSSENLNQPINVVMQVQPVVNYLPVIKEFMKTIEEGNVAMMERYIGK
jgi:hypothetical protein